MKACILSVAGTELTPGESALFADQQPWGVILMGRSCQSRDQVRALVDSIWTAMQRPCLIFIDQEGGRVARLKEPEWPAFPPGAFYGALYDQDPETGRRACWLGHRLIASELAPLGIRADCAPIVDVRTTGAHNIIGDRSFHTDPNAIAVLAADALDGLHDGGVAGVIKHIPGHGRALVDSHLELPRVTSGDNELARDFVAFDLKAEATMAMTAHIAYDAFDRERPATQSRTLIEKVIRKRIGFDGLLMTDDLGMKALGGSLTERAVAATEAGCDVILHCSGFVKDPDIVLDEMREVAEASPELTDKPLQRARAAEAISAQVEAFDARAGWEEFKSLQARPGVAA